MIRQLIAKTHDESVSAPNERIVFTLDVTGNIKSLNAAGERLTGYSFAELSRMNVTQIVSARCAGNVRTQFKRTLGNRFGSVFEIEITTRDGRRVDLEASLDLVKRADGAIEFQGIALPAIEAISSMSDRPRCLDEQFVFGT